MGERKKGFAKGILGGKSMIKKEKKALQNDVIP